MNELRGKGMFTWVISDCEGGDIDQIIEKATEAQLTFLMPKIADGIYEYTSNSDYLSEFVDKCHAADIKVIAWQFVYGTLPTGEANRAIAELSKYDYDGFVINAEGAYKYKPVSAETYCNLLRNAFPNLLIGLSSFRFPISCHPEFPYNEFLKYVDVNMPQVYWEKADGTAASQLDQCIAEYTDSKFIQRPILPTGAAYTNAGWVAQPDDIVDFIERVNELELSACSFWEWRYPRSRFPELWDAIKDTLFEGEEPMPKPIHTGKYKITMLGNLAKRVGPNSEYGEIGQASGDYAKTGEIYTGYEKSPNAWYRIDETEQIWISGTTRWTTITEILEIVPVEPIPEPETPLNPVEMPPDALERLWAAHPELH